MALPPNPLMDVEDYLKLDQNSKNARYEYLDGELRMLAGGSTYHSAIIANLTAILGRALENGPCWVYNSDIRVKLSESRYVYPNVSVSCDQRDKELDDTIHFPCMAVEVLCEQLFAERDRVLLLHRLEAGGAPDALRRLDDEG